MKLVLRNDRVRLNSMKDSLRGSKPGVEPGLQACVLALHP